MDLSLARNVRRGCYASTCDKLCDVRGAKACRLAERGASLRVLLQAFSTLLVAALGFAQPSPPASIPPPPFTIFASIPGDVVRAPSEILLEITLTNVSDQSIGIGVAFESPQWMRFGIDIRDSAGKTVAETEARRAARGGGDRGGPLIKLEPGKVLHTEIILNRLYDLSQPGQYTVQVQRDDLTRGFVVKSNIVTFRIPSLASRRPSKPTFSIAITSALSSVRAGWQVPVEIAVKNLSTKPLRLAIWHGVSSRTHWSLEAQEFGSGIEVRNADGKVVPLTTHGRAFLSGDGWFRGRFLFESIRPGEVLKQTAAIGELSDIDSPGTYTIRAALVDPVSGLPVNSNPLRITVTNTPDDAPPPFVITIRAVDEEEGWSFKVGDVPLQVCMTNISDHELRLDNAITKNDFQVTDSGGNPVPLTNAGRDIRRMFGEGSANTVFPVRPAESLCGFSTLATLFELTKTGRYTVQVGRSDDRDLASGHQRAENLPMVRSNIITVTVAR